LEVIIGIRSNSKRILRGMGDPMVFTSIIQNVINIVILNLL